MATNQLDYRSVFQNLPIPVMLMSPDLTMIDANPALLRLSGKSRNELVGSKVYDVFPDNPSEPGISGNSNLSESVRRTLETGEPDVMAVQRYDVEVIGSPGTFEERYWCPVNTPVRGSHGQVDYIIHSVEEISDLIRKFVDAEAASA